MVVKSGSALNLVCTQVWFMMPVSITSTCMNTQLKIGQVYSGTRRRIQVLTYSSRVITTFIKVDVDGDFNMTKMHFIALADTLKALKPVGPKPQDPRNPTTSESWETGRYVQWYSTLEALADFCKEQNPRFDRSRWVGYIQGENGLNGGSIKKIV